MLFGRSRDEEISIPLSMLGQPTPDVYRLGPDDVLSIYIEGIFSKTEQPLPVHYTDTFRVKPTVGYPVTVRDDGTIALPLLKDPIPVHGKSVEEAQQAILDAYVKAELIQPTGEAAKRMLVTLDRKRRYHVSVLRQEVGGFDSGPEGITGATIISSTTTKRSNGHVVDLPAYQNDVLTALSLSGGLPGLEAYDEILIMRNPSARDRAALEVYLKSCNSGHKPPLPTGLDASVIRIPLRAPSADLTWLRQEDVLLYNGDVVFLEARDLEVFYTGGLLPPGEFVMPRDRDLDVVEAISLVKGTLVNGAFSISSLTGAIIPPGIGGPSPSCLTVIRQAPGHNQIAIRVDLNRAIQDPRERITVKPKDVLILQDTPGEAVARYFTDVFRFVSVYRVWGSPTSRGQGTTTTVVPTVPLVP
jgi:protein involved in polysaccharide export with SLBB domain